MKRLAQVSKVACGCGVALAAALAPAARAQIAPGNGPVDITADRLELVDAQHLAIYRGNVEAVQNGNRLVSDVLNVYFTGMPAAGTAGAKPKPAPKPAAPGAPAPIGSSWGSIDHIVADGHVYFVGQDQTARGEHAVYELEPDTITMTGDVVMVQGDNVVKGDKAIIQVKNGHADVISNATGRNKPDRVRGVFYNNGQTAPGGQPATATPAKPAPAKP